VAVFWVNNEDVAAVLEPLISHRKVEDIREKRPKPFCGFSTPKAHGQTSNLDSLKMIMSQYVSFPNDTSTT
jgi:hypothetical protein